MPGFVGAVASGRHGNTHAKARARAFAALPECSPCARCGRPMHKQDKDRHGKSALHYDHNDTNTGYLGFSHATCNRRAGASKGGRIVAARYGRWHRRRGAQPPIGLRWRSRNW
jgi:hypothetical protein